MIRASLAKSVPPAAKMMSSLAPQPLAGLKLFSWGEGTEGALGHFPFKLTSSFWKSSYEEPLPRAVNMENDLQSQFVDLSTGKDYTLALTRDGRIVSWGSGADGKLGTGVVENKPRAPAFVDVPGVKFAKVYAGYRHSAAVDSEGNLWTWGFGGDRVGGGGQLGQGNRKSFARPTPVESLRGYLAPSQTKITGVSLGESHSLLCTSDGEILSCGVGEYGRLGQGGASDSVVFTPIRALEDRDIVQVSAGESFSLALSADKEVYAFGHNDQYQIGYAGLVSMDTAYSVEELPRMVEVLIPKREAEEEKMTDVTEAGGNMVTPLFKSIHAGCHHAVAITTDGSLVQWGTKRHAQPSLVRFPTAGKKVIAASAGDGFSVAVTTDHKVFTWGKPKNDVALGLGSSASALVPKGVKALRDHKPMFVSAGGSHVFVGVEA